MSTASVTALQRSGPLVPDPARAPRYRAWAAVLAPAALAAVLCVYGLTSRSLGFDEGATVAIASQHGSALWSAIAHDGGNMSGYYLLVHVLIGAFGNGLVVVRLPSVLSIVAAVALIGVIANRLFDRPVAMVAGVLAAVSLPLVYWAQTARGYAMMVAFVCGAFVAFLALSDPREGRPPGRWPWIAYVVAMTLAMYSSFVAVLVVPAQLLMLVHRRRALRRVGSALAVVAVGCAPLIVLAVRRGSGQLFWVTRPTRMVESQVLQSLTSAGLAPSFHHSATTYALMWITVAAIAALLVDLGRRLRRGEPAWAMAVVLSWCVMPAALTFVYSFVSQPIFVPRNLLMSTPALALALAPLIRHRTRPPWLAPVAVAAVVAMRAIPVAAGYSVSPEPWQAVTAHVLAASVRGDCIAFYPEDGRMAFAYYVTSRGRSARAPRAILPEGRWSDVKSYVEQYVTPSFAEVVRRSAGCRRLWFVSSHEGQLDGPPQSRANRARWFRLDAELEALFGPGVVQSYGYASAIHVQLLPGRAVQGRSVVP